MLSLETVVLLSLIVILAFLVKGSVGFGDALIINSLALFLLDIKIIIPMTLLLILMSDIYLMITFKGDINRRIVAFLVLGGILGIFTGSYLFNVLDSRILEIILAFIIIIFSVNGLFFDKGQAKHQFRKSLGVLAGFFTGVISALIGAGGIPTVIYVHHLNLGKNVFRATIITSFFLMDFIRGGAYLFFGILNSSYLLYALYLIPAMLIGIVIGVVIHDRIDENIFRRVVHVFLLVIGINLLI